MKLIDKDAALAMIEELEQQNNCGTDDFIESKRIAYKQVKDGVLEMQETVSMQDEPISEDLETEIEKIRKHHFINDDFDKTELDGRRISNIARHFANWQKRQIMNGSTTRVVHIGEDLCPFIRRYELAFDIKSQVQDVKDGDKVKVIIIKDE